MKAQAEERPSRSRSRWETQRLEDSCEENIRDSLQILRWMDDESSQGQHATNHRCQPTTPALEIAKKQGLQPSGKMETETGSERGKHENRKTCGSAKSKT